MRYTRRDKRLDAALGEKVIVEFKDGKIKRGILEFDEAMYCKECGHYRIDTMCFPKGRVRQFKKIGCEKWVKLDYYKHKNR